MQCSLQVGNSSMHACIVCASPDVRDLHPGRLALVQEDVAQLQAMVGDPLPLQELIGNHNLLEETPAHMSSQMVNACTLK